MTKKKRKPAHAASPAGIICRSIEVQTLGDNAGVFVGRTDASDWRVFRKHQSALSASDHSRISRTIAILVDRDAVDYIVNGRTPKQKRNVPKRV
jgi:hypothetical protein